jgi:hypothetical protein
MLIAAMGCASTKEQTFEIQINQEQSFNLQDYDASISAEEFTHALEHAFKILSCDASISAEEFTQSLEHAFNGQTNPEQLTDGYDAPMRAVMKPLLPLHAIRK